MATSGAAVNTFMGNMNIFAPLRWLMILFNIRIGLLAPSPFLRKAIPIFWPFYTFLEFIGKAKTTSYRVQVSDGGHIENLGVYELLRRKVKTIIVIDSGQDAEFNFSDLRNLIIRAKNELGAIIEFDNGSNPLIEIKPSLITGRSKKHFSIAKISGLDGSYADGYEGVLIYVKSSVLDIREFKIRELKKEVAELKRKNNDKFERKRRELDHTMYRVYSPDFPHQTTNDQFFSEDQWDAYYHLGNNMGERILLDLGINEKDSRLEIYAKCTKIED